MMFSRVVALVVVALCLVAKPVASLFEDSKYVQLMDPETYDNVVQSSRLVWCTLWFDPNDAASQKLAGYTAEAAASIYKFGARFAAIDVTEHPEFFASYRMSSVPSFTFSAEPPSRNPYTKKLSRELHAIKGADSIDNSRFIKRIISGQMGIAPVTSIDNNPSDIALSKLLKVAKSKEQSHVAIYFTKKKKASPSTKSLAMQFFEVAPVATVVEVSKLSSSSLAKQLGVTRLPALVLLEASTKLPENDAPIPALVLKGKPTFEAMVEFIEEHAMKPEPKENLSVDTDFEVFTDAKQFESDVLHGTDAWVVIGVQSNVWEGKQNETLVTLGRKAWRLGRTHIGVLRCAELSSEANIPLCSQLSSSADEVIFASYPLTKEAAETKKKMSQHETLKKAFKAATSSLPSGRVHQIDESSLNSIVYTSMQATPRQVPILLLTEKPKVPVMVENAADVYEKFCRFAVIVNPSETFLAGVGVTKLPQLLALTPYHDKDDPNKMKLQAVGYNKNMFGKFSYPSIHDFVELTIQHFGLRDDKNPDSKPVASERTPEVSDVPFEELTVDNFVSNCVTHGGLCLIAIFNPADDNEDRITLLEKLHDDRTAGYTYSWLSAPCHKRFVDQFGIDEFALPTIVALNPKKSAFTRFVGKFDSNDVKRFAKLATRGRGDVQKLQNAVVTPQYSSDECKQILRELQDTDPVDESPGNDDDTEELDLAEFLRQTAAEEKAKEEALATEARKAEENRDPCDDPNLNEWGQKECKAKAARKKQLEEEKRRMVEELRAKRKATKKGKKKGKKSKKRKGKKANQKEL